MGKELIKNHLHLHGLVSPWPGSSIEQDDLYPSSSSDSSENSLCKKKTHFIKRCVINQYIFVHVSTFSAFLGIY